MSTVGPDLAIFEIASSSQKAMPFIFLNMAGEMAYILEQRLVAQKIAQARCRQVLGEVLKIVFNEKFLNKLFGPQEQFSRSSLRQYFEKMANSSVMRLNESSMDRLFDMITMTVKYQFMLIVDPSHLVNVTINHLNGIRQIANFDEDVLTNVKHAHELLVKTYNDTQTWEFYLIKCALLNHFQDLKIKVSQLIHLGFQLYDGYFVLYKSPIKIFGTPPGTIRYFEKGQLSRITTFVIEDEFETCNDSRNFDLVSSDSRCTTLGDNIFRDDPSNPKDHESKKKRSVTGADEIKLLSQLINRPEPAEGKDNFTLSLFDDEDVPSHVSRLETSAQKKPDKRPRSKQRSSSGAPSAPSESKVKTNKKSLAGAMQEMEIKSAPKKTKGEQLLKMMDDQEAKPATQKAPRSRSESRKTIRNQSAVGQKKT